MLLIRAEEHRVLFGFWRGQRLTEKGSEEKVDLTIPSLTSRWGRLW